MFGGLKAKHKLSFLPVCRRDRSGKKTNFSNQVAAIRGGRPEAIAKRDACSGRSGASNAKLNLPSSRFFLGKKHLNSEEGPNSEQIL